MILGMAGSLEAIAPQIQALAIQTAVYFVLASVAGRAESLIYRRLAK